jgi:transcriptional regulator with XRE-family HTH domain
MPRSLVRLVEDYRSDDYYSWRFPLRPTSNMKSLGTASSLSPMAVPPCPRLAALVKMASALEWRNWQTHETQNLALCKQRGGSTPPSSIESGQEIRGLPPSSKCVPAPGAGQRARVSSPRARLNESANVRREEAAALKKPISTSLRVIRIEKGLSQGDIERRTGILRSYLSRVENGHTVPSLETLSRIAAALQVSLSELVDPSNGGAARKAPPFEDRPQARFWKLMRKYVPVLKEPDRRLLAGLARRMATPR